MLCVKCVIIPPSWNVRGPGGWPSLSAHLCISTLNFKAVCPWNKQVCVGLASLPLNGSVSMECVPWHTLKFLLPTDSLLLCLAAANSAKQLMALSAGSPQSSKHCWKRLWSLPGATFIVISYVNIAVCILSAQKHISYSPRLPISYIHLVYIQVPDHETGWMLLSISQIFIFINVETDFWREWWGLTVNCVARNCQDLWQAFMYSKSTFSKS